MQHAVKGKLRAEEGEKINDDISPCDLGSTRNGPDACRWPSLSVNSVRNVQRLEKRKEKKEEEEEEETKKCRRYIVDLIWSG